MSTQGEVRSFAQVARDLKLSPHFLSGMVTALGLPIERISTNGQAKGLSSASVREIESRLTKSVAS